MLLLAVGVFAAGAVGVEWRESLWGYSAPARFTGDIANALAQGDRVLDDAGGAGDGTGASWAELFRAYVARYDKVRDLTPEGQNADLDYPPGRLLIATLWARQTRLEFGPGGYEDRRAGFMLRINYALEAAAAVAILLFVRSVLIASGKTKLVALTWACVSAVLFWLNPALLINAHAWPQWDVWLVPFYVLAAWCVYMRWGLAAGALLVVVSLLKGQLLIVSALMLLWPIFRGDWRTALGVAAGFLAMTAALMSPWLVASGWATSIWIATTVATLIVTLAAAWFLRRKVGPTVVASIGLLIMALAVLLIGPRTGGSMNWLTIGFPTTRYPYMALGPLHNLPAILAETWRWRVGSPVELLGVVAPLRSWMQWLFFGSLAVSAIGLAWSSRRRSTHVIVGVVAPWVMLFAVMPQMHERYMTWGAVLSAMLVAVRPAYVLVYICLTTQAVAMMLSTQLPSAGQRDMVWPEVWSFSQKLGPFAGYTTMTLAVLLLAASFPGPKSEPDTPKPV